MSLQLEALGFINVRDNVFVSSSFEMYRCDEVRSLVVIDIFPFFSMVVALLFGFNPANSMCQFP